jgi:lipopolysaccharide/colanic/teichoic acid biosynthesis glycosyltransferase
VDFTCESAGLWVKGGEDLVEQLTQQPGIAGRSISRPHQSYWDQYQREIYFAIKRLMDVVIASAALIILFPIMLVVAVLVRLDSPGPAFFKQERVTTKRTLGAKGETWELTRFICYKFRSMYTDTDCEPHKAFIKAFIQNDQDAMAEINEEDPCARKLVNDPRVSRVGRLIRKTSIDELPQLLNVLKGDMSIVGPRPAIPYEVEMYQAHHYGRLEAKPGLTGWWQVNGRGSAEFEEGINQDIWYVRHQSLWLDIVIILKTPWVVLFHKGAM